MVAERSPDADTENREADESSMGEENIDENDDDDSDSDSDSDFFGTTFIEIDQGGVSNQSGRCEPGEGRHAYPILSSEPPGQGQQQDSLQISLTTVQL